MSLFYFRPTVNSFDTRRTGFNIPNDRVIIAGNAYFNARKYNTDAKPMQFPSPITTSTPFKFSAAPRETMYQQFAKAHYDEKELREYRERLEENINGSNDFSRENIKNLIPEYGRENPSASFLDEGVFTLENKTSSASSSPVREITTKLDDMTLEDIQKAELPITPVKKRGRKKKATV
jgi:hypothetical protein